jgi:amino acid transporter
MLLDFAATAVVSAAAAAVYLSSEAPSLPFPAWVGAVIVLVLFTIISLLGIRESTRVALVVLSVHVRSRYRHAWDI